MFEQPINSECTYLEELTEQGYASLHQLKKAGIKRKFDMGINDEGKRDFTIIDSNNNQWEYSHEDNCYVLQRKADPILLNSIE